MKNLSYPPAAARLRVTLPDWYCSICLLTNELNELMLSGISCQKVYLYSALILPVAIWNMPLRSNAECNIKLPPFAATPGTLGVILTRNACMRNSSYIFNNWRNIGDVNKTPKAGIVYKSPWARYASTFRLVKLSAWTTKREPSNYLRAFENSDLLDKFEERAGRDLERRELERGIWVVWKGRNKSPDGTFP